MTREEVLKSLQELKRSPEGIVLPNGAKLRIEPSRNGQETRVVMTHVVPLNELRDLERSLSAVLGRPNASSQNAKLGESKAEVTYWWNLSKFETALADQRS